MVPSGGVDEGHELVPEGARRSVTNKDCLARIPNRPSTWSLHDVRVRA